MNASATTLVRCAAIAATLIATAACTDSLVDPASSLSPAGISFNKSDGLPVEVRALTDKNGLTLFQVTTGDFDGGLVPPGQIRHVQFKLCKGESKRTGINEFSANFEYHANDADKDDTDKDPDYTPDTPDDPGAHAGRVNWDRSRSHLTLDGGGYGAFQFTGLTEDVMVQVTVWYRTLTVSTDSKGNVTVDKSDHKYQTCVPVKKAPNPTLTGAGFLGLSGPDFAFSNTPVVYNLFISDPNGTARTTGTCNIVVDGVVAGTGTYSTSQESGGVCTFTLTFAMGGSHVVVGSVGNVAPIDYDIADNSASLNVNVSGPTGGGTGGGSGGSGGGSGGSGGGPESVVASFSALGTIQTVNTPNGFTTLTAYSDLNTKTTAFPAFNVGDALPTQGVNIKVTLLKLLPGPFDITANLSTDGSRLGSFTVTGLTLSADNIYKAPGRTSGTSTLSPGDLCSQIVTVDNPEGYQAQVCTNSISNQTVYYFNTHANFDGNIGHFVPYGASLTFDSDLVSGAKHYRIPQQAFDLVTSTGLPLSCTRYAAGSVMATCGFSENTTTRAGSNAQRSNIIIFGTDN